jgi:Ca-activated chloride channel family protein
MTESITPDPSQLNLAAGLDRTLAWEEGGSVRYLVADLSAQDAAIPSGEVPALNLALAIDVSGSMAGDKIDAARRAALAVAETLTRGDRLSIIAFNSSAEVLLDARQMDEAGRAAARMAIGRLVDGGRTNLFGGWLVAAERVALAMPAAPQASHRVLLLSDGQTNEGVTDRREIAGHAGAWLERGVLTSALGIGDGYDEELLGGIAEAGGGNLHDAGQAPEIAEVVLGELREGRAALMERVTLRVAVPANLRAEVVGPWAHAAVAGMLEVMVGNLLPHQTKRVVFRLHCPSGVPHTAILLGVSAGGTPPGSTAAVEARPIEVELRLARSAENNAQPRHIGRSVAVVRAWQADALRRAVRMNREGDRGAASHFLARELRWIEPYARGVPGTETLVAELILVQRRVSEELDERTRKELFAASYKQTRSEHDLRSAKQASISERFGPSSRKR